MNYYNDDQFKQNAILIQIDFYLSLCSLYCLQFIDERMFGFLKQEYEPQFNSLDISFDNTIIWNLDIAAKISATVKIKRV